MPAQYLTLGELLVDLLVGELLRDVAGCKVFVGVVLAVPADVAPQQTAVETIAMMFKARSSMLACTLLRQM